MADADVQGMLIRIEATTAQLRQEIARGEAAVAQSAGKMDTSLGRIDTAFDRAGASAEGAASSIKNALAAAIGAASIGTIIKTADSYSQMSDRIGLATKSFGEYNTVQERLLTTANRTYRPLEEAQELYIRTSDSLRSMGLSASQSMDVMDSFSYLLVTNSATADKASSAIDAYSKSLQTGKVEADSWQAILAAMPTIVDTLSKATNKSAEEIRNLGAQGKLGLDVLTEGLQKSAEANGLLADSMGVAVRDALVALNNAFSVYVGQLNESTDGTGVLASGISVLADNFGAIAEIAGVAAAGALAVYARGLAVSAAGSVLATKAAIEDAMARRAQAASVLLAAQADQQKAQTAVFLAEKEAIAARGAAVQAQMSLQLAEARMVEARATAAVGAAQSAIVGTGRTIMGLLGGPAGIAMLAIGAATAFLTLRDNTSDLEKKLGDLSDPIDKLTKRFNELDRATQSVTLRELRSSIADAQEDLSTAAGSIAFEFQSSLTNAGLAGASGFMAGIAPLPAEFQAAIDVVKKASEDQAKGMVVDWKAVADQVRQVPGVTSEMADALEKSGGSAAVATAELNKLKSTVSQLTGETDELTRAERENAAAKAEAAGVGQKYLEQLQKQLGAAQDKTALAAANRFISENILLTEDMITAIRSAAAAKDAQKAADDAASKATKSGTSAAKEAATEAKNQAKALTDLKAQAEIAINSATGLAAAYLAGTDKSREFTLQQKVEEALLKTGAGVRKDVEKAINDQQDAQDKLNISKAAYDLGKETEDLLAQAKATLQGADALAAYNVQKSMTVALAGKNIEVGSQEYKQLLAATKAQQDAVKVAQQAANAGSIMDRLYPEQKLLREYTEGQAALNRAMELAPEKAADYQAALVRLSLEYEQNKNAATAWGQFTEGAVDRVDSAFADAWKNIDDGFSGFATSLKDGFKQLLAELAHMAITKPIIMQIGASLGVGGLSAQSSGLFGGSSGGGTDIFSLAKGANQLYSVANSGFGQALSSGWASGDGLFGGLQNAFSGGYGYVGSALGFGSGAAGAAASSGLAQGAAAYGSQFGTGIGAVSFPGAAGGAAGGAASGAASSGLSGLGAAGYGIGGALYGYSQAGLKGAATGAAGAVGGAYAGAAIGSVVPIIGTAIGAAIGAVLGGVVGGSLFGGDWQTKDQGLSLGVENGDFAGQQFEYQKKKGGLFGKNKKRTRLSALDPQMQAALDATYDATEGSVLTLFDRLNVQLNDGVLDGLNIAASQISTKDKTAEQIQEEITKWFGGVADSMVSAVDAATGAGLGGFNFESLTTFVNNLYGVNEAIRYLNVGMFDLSVSGGKMAEQLSAMAGGLDALKASNATYYDNFYSDAEKADDSLDAVSRQFKALNIALPETREGYRSMVEALDLATEAGRAMFVTLTGLAGNAASAYSILEQRATEAAKATADALMGSVTSAQSALQRAISAQQKATTEAYNARVTSLNDMVSTATENVSGLTSVGNDLGAALKALRGDSDDAVKMLRAQAQATLQSALATARSGGSLSGFTGLSDALDTVSSNNTDLYGSMEDFARDQGRTANVVAELNALNGKQLTTEEQLLTSLRDQIKLAKDQFDEEMAKFDQQLEFAQAQLDAINGTDNSIKSVVDAINAMNASVVAALGAISFPASSNTPQNNGSIVDTLYQSVLGRAADADGKAYWAGKLQSGELSYKQIAESLANGALAFDSGSYSGPVSQDALAASKAAAQKYLDSLKVPGFATGGDFGGGLRLVGENGPELEVTGPSRIFNANQTASMLRGGGDSGATAAEIREFRREMESNATYMARLTKVVADGIETLVNSGVQILGPVETKAATA